MRMEWVDHETFLEISLPEEFNFYELLVFLGRSEYELLHRIVENELYKLLKIDQKMILIRISNRNSTLKVEFLSGEPGSNEREQIVAYIYEWFDLEKDLTSFYSMANEDHILSPLVKKYAGLRMIGIPDLFEALTWAIIGQQINLTFAYTLKSRLVTQFGEKLVWNGETYWLHPSAQRIALLEVEDLKKLQFTTRKSEYILDIAKLITESVLTKTSLKNLQDNHAVHETLMAIRGVGAWTADYVMMKCLNDPSAFPIADVGLHNALKIQLELERKPTIEEIKEIATNWSGWQAYATFYLWRSLYE